MAKKENYMLIAAIIVALLAFALFTALYVVYRNIFYNPKPPREADPYRGLDSKYLDGMRDVIREQIDALGAYPCEEIRVRSHGKTLFGRYYHGEGQGPVAIFFHGYKGSSYTELSGAALLALSHGNSALVVDHRAHGKSSGRTVSFGIKERLDVVTWVRYIKNRFNGKRGCTLFGISMGGASVLMASELLTADDGVRCIIADCPFSSPEGIIRRVLGNRGLPPRLYGVIALSAVLIGHFRLGASTAKDAVGSTEIPILLIHGEADDFVPPEMSREIAASGKGIELFTVPGAAHGQSFAVGKDDYVKTVLDFSDRYSA